MDPMTTNTQPWPAGVPCWADLMVPEPDAVMPFYEAVFGWTFAAPDAQYGGYVLASAGGQTAAGLGPLMEGARAGWTMYFASDDAAATAAAVSAADGALFGEPAAVGPLGTMFVATDPTGAVFGVWQAGTFRGSEVTNGPGGLVWEDLRSTDPDTARAFYNSLFGFDYQHVDMASADYTMFTLAGDDRPRGGIGGMMGSEGVDSHWLLYFGVADVAKAISAATANGGAAPIPPFQTPYGTMAGLTDPAGVTVYIVEMPAQAQPTS